MIRRGQSNRITRRKSAVSIHSQPHTDPESSRQQAYSAATYAFARAQERSSGDMGPDGAVAMGNTAIPREENIHPRTDNGTNGGVLKHQQSVRFAGPLAAPRPALGTRTIQQNSVQKQISTGSLRPRASTGDAPIFTAYRPQSRSSSLEKASFRQVGPESYATALAAYDEYYTREDDVVTTPSSYRKIRRSKSMLHSDKAQGALISNGTPESSIAGQRKNGLLRSKSNVALRAPKSMSYIQGVRSRSAQNPEYDIAVQVARDKFLHQVEQQRLREQPSFLFRSIKARREEKSLRRSFRANSSTNSYGMPIASENQNSHRGWDDTLKNRARQASRSLKNKLKGFFRRGNGDGAIPDQEVQAQKSHITDYEIQIGPPTVRSSAYEESPPGRATLSSVSTRQPSLRMVSSSHQLRSIAGSMQSLTSEASSRSRVMSWTNTDTTANSRYAAAERERERLSVINENGTHKASSSFNRPPLKNQYSAYPDFNPPGSTHGHPLPLVGQVDSARVYSALMRRLDENSPEAKLTKQKDNSISSRSPKRVVPGSGSVDSRQSSQGYKSTIIRVETSSDDLFESTGPFQSTNQSNDVFYTARSYNDSGSIGHRRGNSNSSASTVITRKPNYRAYPPPIMGDLPTKITPQEAVVGVELQGTIGRGARETRSTFFGGTEMTNIGGTPSPYRRAMAEADLNSIMSQMGMSSADSSPFLSDNLRREKSALSLADSEPDRRNIDTIDGAYTESIYSRTTSGRTPPEIGEPPQANEDSTPPKLGSAILVERSIYRPLTAPPHRVNASTGSTDWKTWMSAQVSKLERAKESVDAATSAVHLVPHVVPTMPKIFGGHVREMAQISGDDTAALVVPKATAIPDQLLGVFQENANVSPKPSPENTLPSSSLVAPNVTPTLSQRVVHSSLRQAPSRNSMRSVNTVLKERVLSNSAANVVGASAGNTPSSQGEGAKAQQRMQRKQSSATLQSVQAPNKFVRKNGRRASNDNAQLPNPRAGLAQVAVEKFASVGGRVAGMENWTPAKVDGLARDEGVMVRGRGPELDRQVMGSRRMVDLFLSSRRKRVAGSEDSNVFL